ncbi:hypothetical protein ETA_26730 [Erwinia tasmaniensis Et1/99]|uniref:Uncharacterized protein n=1 Tax=Erwinia tasmaniensis (strain DSM 17950 / CFBP 7177 / CIP 109463 / NCPPB 4357 / Et1/99) TaxID=465817 RepID=B2VG30_ERWT9|nr:hypothetical protein ETA_26730 [Erwinia tasmaniensis Et1/99]
MAYTDSTDLIHGLIQLIYSVKTEGAIHPADFFLPHVLQLHIVVIHRIKLLSFNRYAVRDRFQLLLRLQGSRYLSVRLIISFI